MARYSYLAREEVLKYIDTLRVITQTVKIVVLDNQEHPLRAIEGRATGGSININGSSAVRRTGSITLVTELQDNTDNPLDILNEITNIDALISMNKRVQIEIGIKNSGNRFKEYDIFWIPLGTFVISNASVTYNSQGIQISLNLKDKMALLNGEFGGTFVQAVIHSPVGWTEAGTGKLVDEGVKMRSLIESILHTYGELNEYEIAIEDIPARVKNIISWKNSEYNLKIDAEGNMSLSDLDAFYADEKIKIYQKGDAIGYTETDFVYPFGSGKTLESKAGSTVTQVLDEIKNTLGNYEYFFDLDGIFRFREIPNSLSQGSAEEELLSALAEKYFINAEGDKATYSFNDSSLITSYANNPQYTQIKNEYSIWGQTPESKTDIQYHLVLTEAPRNYESQKWKVEIKWIYQEGYEPDNGFHTIIDAYECPDVELNNFCSDGGDGDWFFINFEYLNEKRQSDLLKLKLYFIAVSKQGKNLSAFDRELLAKIPHLFDLNLITVSSVEGANEIPYRSKLSNLTYWLDIINTKDPLLINTINISKFGIENIGRKTQVIVDNNINCLIASKAPDNFWPEPEREDKGHDFTPSETDEDKKIYFWECVSLGTVENSAYDLLRSSIHEHLGYNNNINITTIPVYHLDVNQRIAVNNRESDIHGDYIINTISVPLTPDGMMTINARKAIERI